MQPTVNGSPIENGVAVVMRRGDLLRFRGRRGGGARTYIAIGGGGIDVPLYLGSRSTFVHGGLGGFGGRALRSGDVLKVFAVPPTASPPPRELLPALTHSWEIGALAGRHCSPDYFTDESMEEFWGATFVAHYNSNRLGVKLVGPKPRWARASGGDAGLHPSNIHDSLYCVGAVVHTGDTPVMIGVDGPSLGGFVACVTIASAEQWKIGQVVPGDVVRFKKMAYADALRADADRAAVLGGPVVESKPVAAPPPPPEVAAEYTRYRSNAVLLDIPADAAGPASPRLQVRMQVRARPTAPASCGSTMLVCAYQGDKMVMVECGEMVLDLSSRFRVQVCARDAWFVGYCQRPWRRRPSAHTWRAIPT